VCITAWLSEPQQLEVSHVKIDRAVMVAWQLEVLRIPLSSRLRRLMESSTFRALRESYALRTKLGIFRMIGANETGKNRIAKFGYSDDPNNRIFGYLVIRVIRITKYSVIRLFRSPE
jgi:hypothetical protein